MKLETIQRDKVLAEKALISSNKKAEELEAEAQQQKEAHDALRKRISELPEDDRCPATDSELDGMY